MSATLADVCSITMGQAPAGESYNDRGEGLPLIAGAGDFKGDSIVPTKFTTRPSKVSAVGDIVLSIRASIGAKVVSDGVYCLGRGVAGLRPGPRLDRAYLWHWLSQSEGRLAAKGRGATFLQVNRVDLAEMPIELPPIDEQRRIAAILDHANALRAKRRQVLARLDALTPSIFRDMFGDVCTNERGWTAATVDDVAERVTDGEHKTPRRSDFGVPLLSARNVRDGWIDFDNSDFIDEEEFATLSRRIEPRSGDVLISCSGTIGRVAQVRERPRFAMVRSTALVRPNALVHPTFLERALASPALKATMVSRANSSAQANLFQNQIKRLPMVVPPLDIQIRFAALVDAVDTARGAVVAAEAADDELFASLQSRAFRGAL